jgi:predicted neutral ceramidase superfamily lipid hydrolase
MEKGKKTWLLPAVMGIVVIVAALLAASVSLIQLTLLNQALPPYFIPGDIEFYYVAQAVVSTVNVTLLAFLLGMYVNIYSKTRSEFTVGLIIFSVVFLLYALSSNPFVIKIFGFRQFGLGPFALLPDLFTFGALLVLLYLCLKY